MALIDCPDCNHKVSDNAASCPSCGRIMLAYNDLNFPSYHVAAAALVFAILSITIPSNAPWWLKLSATLFLVLVLTLITWIMPAVSERRQLRKARRQSKPRDTKYKPRESSADQKI
jgi:uncharacterized protein (DUF983 family)